MELCVMNKLFVGNLSWKATEDELREFFAQIGEVLDARIVTDPYTGRSRGFGFITMAEKEAADKAVKELDGKEIDGRPIRISPALDKKEGREGSSGNFSERGHRSGGGGRGERSSGGFAGRSGPRQPRGGGY